MRKVLSFTFAVIAVVFGAEGLVTLVSGVHIFYGPLAEGRAFAGAVSAFLAYALSRPLDKPDTHENPYY